MAQREALPRPFRPAARLLTLTLLSQDYPYPLTSETEYHTYMLGPEEGEKLDASISTRFPDWKNRQSRLGMQFNIAITDFAPETGGTQFVRVT